MNPLAFTKKAIPGLSNANKDMNRPRTNTGNAHLRKPISFLTNGSERRNNPKGKTKKSVPPQAENANPRNMPPQINLAKAILLDDDLIPLKNR